MFWRFQFSTMAKNLVKNEKIHLKKWENNYKMLVFINVSRVDDLHGFVFGRGDNQRAVSLPADALNALGVIANHIERTIVVDVPQVGVILRRGHEYILHVRIPLHTIAAVLLQVQTRQQVHVYLRRFAVARVVVDGPQLNLRVKTARRQYGLVALGRVVVLDVRDGSTVRVCDREHVIAERELATQVVLPQRAYAAARRAVNSERNVFQIAIDQAAYRVREAICRNAAQNLLKYTFNIYLFIYF